MPGKPIWQNIRRVGSLWLALGILAFSVGVEANYSKKPRVGTKKVDRLLVRPASPLPQAVLSTLAKPKGLPENFDAVFQHLVANQGGQISGYNAQLHFYRVHYSGSEAAMAAAATALQATGLFAWVEPDRVRYAMAPLVNGPNDYYYQNDQTWWTQTIAADRAFAEISLSAGPEVVLAVLDTGVRSDHEDLAAVLLAGRNFVDPGMPPEDDKGHGTHVAGLAAAVTNNGIGIAGCNFAGRIRILPVKVLNAQGFGYDADIAEAIRWAVDQGARVICMSLGGPESNTLLREAVDYAYARGCAVVVAAGNSGLPQDGNPVIYPAAYPETIAVGATNRDHARAFYSSYGNYVDLAAPGGDDWTMQRGILSTYYETSQDYILAFGTSMACPQVAGAAAMLLAQNPARSPEDVALILQRTAVKVGSLAQDADGYNQELGWGELNLYQALRLEAGATAQSPNLQGKTYNYPNPFAPNQGEVTTIVVPPFFQSSGNAPMKVILTITDSFGAQVYEKQASFPSWTEAFFTWDGCLGSGQRVANGVYLYRVTMPGATAQNKIVVLNQ
jgi:subtilisin family serine protease